MYTEVCTTVVHCATKYQSRSEYVLFYLLNYLFLFLCFLWCKRFFLHTCTFRCYVVDVHCFAKHLTWAKKFCWSWSEWLYLYCLCSKVYFRHRCRLKCYCECALCRKIPFYVSKEMSLILQWIALWYCLWCQSLPLTQVYIKVYIVSVHCTAKYLLMWAKKCRWSCSE